MRIAFDHQIFALQAFGGISRYFVELAKALSVQHEVSIHAPWYQNEYLSELKSHARLFVQGKALHGKFAKLARAAMPVSRRLAGNSLQLLGAQVVHETYYSAKPTHAYLPRVVTVYDMIHELFPADFSKFSKTSADKRKAVARADHVICISESTQRDLVRLFEVPIEKTSVVYLGFESFQHFDSAPPRDSKPYLLYVGQRGGYKNFALFLKAVAASKELSANFDVLAFGGGPFSATEHALIAQLGLAPTQVRHQSGSDAALASAYQNAALFVYPSAYEGFGLPPLEAMANRVPVVSSNVSSMPEVIGTAAEYFDPNDASSLTRAMEAVLRSPERALELRELGSERIKRFSWQACAAETLAVYERALKR